MEETDCRLSAGASHFSRSNLFRIRGYTLVELFLTLAVLMILLGMMMNVSNRVRHESADKVTRQILSRLAAMISDYQNKNDGQLPPISPVIQPGFRPSEDTLQAAALANNADLVRYLNLPALARQSSNTDDPLFRSLHQTESQQWLLQDPWGGPVVFMPHEDPAIGLPPGDTFFLFSAGPDRLFLTKEDNLYSYEDMGVKENAE